MAKLIPFPTPPAKNLSGQRRRNIIIMIGSQRYSLTVTTEITPIGEGQNQQKPTGKTTPVVIS